MKTGRVARLNDRSFPGRTTLMKVSNVSTLWDYINRAMPWNAPKSLSVDEVYAVTAYLLNMGEVLPESFVLSDKNHRRGPGPAAQPQRQDHRPRPVAGPGPGQWRQARRAGPRPA